MTNTVVIYGSGYSLNRISKKEWDKLERFDSVGFNWFILQRWIEPTFMIVGDIRHDKKNRKLGRTIEDSYKNYRKYTHDERYKKTVFYINKWQLGMFKEFDRKYKLWEWPKGWDRSGVLLCLKLCSDLGYKNIIFAGIDLYDFRYFYLPKNRKRRVGIIGKNIYKKIPTSDLHPLANRIVKWFNKNKDKTKHLNIYSYNPQSLLLKCSYIKNWKRL